MITEDYVSFETAKLLKEKRFAVPCRANYRSCYAHDKVPFYHGLPKDFNGKEYERLNSEWFSAPTLQMAMKWLREVHKLVITISILNENDKSNTDYRNPDRWFYFFDITNEKGVVIDIEFNPLDNEFSTYEEATEAAIRYSLENLI